MCPFPPLSEKGSEAVHVQTGWAVAPQDCVHSSALFRDNSLKRPRLAGHPQNVTLIPSVGDLCWAKWLECGGLGKTQALQRVRYTPGESAK